MGDEAGVVSGDQRAVLSDAQAGRLACDNPAAHHRMVTAEVGERVEGLDDVPLAAIVPRMRYLRSSAADDLDILALTRQ